MTRNPETPNFQHALHTSYSQLNTYQMCPLKYFFAYVQGRPPERVSVALPFGKAIHSGIEAFYRALMEETPLENPKPMETAFEEALSPSLEDADTPLVFQKDLPDPETTMSFGKTMLRAFFRDADLNGHTVVDVEKRLSARLFTPEGKLTEFQLVGVVDLLLQDEEGRLIAVDHKTAARSKSEFDVRETLQFSAYAYLLASNKMVEKSENVKCRMDVLRKLKKPKVERHDTARDAMDRKRFARVACEILKAIDHRAFYPIRSWMCASCSYAKACDIW